ncbi:unnamed protein product [Phytophthora fragariaefolia]|uniref:Unnamed protein product n=1 Tax=Phytophthora fragariaefolia TaxID=1490495 RepID=A0A9W6TM05_9STRA|nr:unnamed protein product [Phytophthora fragariaefolia]
MDCGLRGLTWICCLVYLADVVIFTKGTVARLVVALAVVLESLAEAGLSLKATKCSFATTRMEYLGHDLTPEGIQPTDRLVKAIVDFRQPQDAAEVRRFVALAGYYRRFVPDFGAKMSPLTRLLRKGSEWQWGTEQEEAFTWAKAWLSQKLVLIYPDYKLPFKLTTDALKTGLGAVLSQDQGRGDQPVAYALKVNSAAVAKYGISELECLVVVWAVRLFRPPLYGRKFAIVTDHVALKWLMTVKEPVGRLHRWALTLQEYDFTFEYRPGKENQVADALSRGPPLAGADEEADDVAAREEPAISTEDDHSSSSDKVLVLTARDGSTEVLTPLDLTAAVVRRCMAVRREDAGCAVNAAEQQLDAPKTILEAEIERAAMNVVQAVAVHRVEAAELGVVQFTDEDIRREQTNSLMVQTLLKNGACREHRVYTGDDGLVCVDLGDDETRTILPVTYWALAFKEAHDSI